MKPQLADQSGVSAALLYLAIFLSTYQFGRAADRGRVHWLTRFGLLGYAATLVLLRHATSHPAIYALRFAEGSRFPPSSSRPTSCWEALRPPRARALALVLRRRAFGGLLLGPAAALLAGLDALLVVGAFAVALSFAAGRSASPSSPRLARKTYASHGAARCRRRVWLHGGRPRRGLPGPGLRRVSREARDCLLAVIVAAAVFSLLWEKPLIATERVPS